MALGPLGQRQEGRAIRRVRRKVIRWLRGEKGGVEAEVVGLVKNAVVGSPYLGRWLSMRSRAQVSGGRRSGMKSGKRLGGGPGGIGAD